MRHALTFSANEGCAGVHISCPESGQYGDFVRELISSDGSWIQKPGKVVVRLSNIISSALYYRVLSRLFNEDKFMLSGELSHMTPVIWMLEGTTAFSKANNLGLPWDPDEASYDWELLFSTVECL